VLPGPVIAKICRPFEVDRGQPIAKRKNPGRTFYRTSINFVWLRYNDSIRAHDVESIYIERSVMMSWDPSTVGY
jgi:hypothetical protein